jgi:hypothetical protein
VVLLSEKKLTLAFVGERGGVRMVFAVLSARLLGGGDFVMAEGAEAERVAVGEEGKVDVMRTEEEDEEEEEEGEGAAMSTTPKQKKNQSN